MRILTHKMFKRTLWGVFVFLGLYFFVFLPANDATFAAFKVKEIPIDSIGVETQNGNIFAARIGDKTKPTLLMIHGSPGDWTAWKSLLLTTRIPAYFNVMAIDRPGYGKTNVKGRTLAAQSRALKPLIEQYCNPCVVLGHSYGAALAFQLALDYPERFNRLISLAGTLAAPYQSPRWYNHIASNVLINWLLPKDFKTSNAEMVRLASDLEIIESKLKQLQLPVVLWQGEADVLVNPDTPFYLLSTLTEVDLYFDPAGDHFVPWTDQTTIERLLLSNQSVK